MNKTGRPTVNNKAVRAGIIRPRGARAELSNMRAKGLRCVREHCDEPVHARGLCRKCYMREWRELAFAPTAQ